MKQFKHKKFIGLALIVFLIFMVLGKYTQSTAFTSSSKVYATTVVDKKTGNKVRFEVRKIKGDKYQVKNTETGDTYEADAQATEDHSLSFKLPSSDGSSEGTIRITPSMVPGGEATVEMTDSDNYNQIDGGSQVIERTDESSSSSSSQVKSIIDSIVGSSSSTTSDTADTSSSMEADVKTKMDVSGGKETTYIADYSREDVQAISEAFGKWLYQSDYAKDAILVQSSFDSITKIDEGSPTFLSFEAPAEKGSKKTLNFLANLINADGYENLSGIPSGVIGGKEASNSEFRDYKNIVDAYALGIDGTSGKVADYSPTSSFRLYTLKDKKHAFYEDNEAEQKGLFNNFSASDKTGGKYKGYSKFYDDLVDQDKKSYQIVLGSNGVVYYVTNYWIGKYDKKAVQTYEVAPDDMQEAYQELLKRYSGADQTETETSTEATSSSSESSDSQAQASSMDINAIKANDFSSIEGTWTNGNNSELTFTKDAITVPQDNEVRNDRAEIDGGYLKTSLRTGMYGAIILFIPKGVTLPDPSGNYPDASDSNRDRILITQSGSGQADNKQFFYKQ